MIRFILSRLWQGALVLVGVACTVFFLFQVLPGDPVAHGWMASLTRWT